jgi:signal transduction histidine kinase
VGVRIGMLVGSIALLLLTYHSNLIRQRADVASTVYLGAVAAWFAVLLYKNGLGSVHALGFLVVLIVTTTVLSTALVRLTGLYWFGVFAMGLAIAATVAVPDPDMNAVLFLMCTLLGVGAVVTSVSARTRLLARLQQRETYLAEAEPLAGIGSWEQDMRTDWRRWSDGMYAIVGMEPREGAVPLLNEFVLSEDRPELEAVQYQLRNGASKVDHCIRIVQSGGSVRTIRSIIRMDRDRYERPLRMYGVVVDVTDQVKREADLKHETDEAVIARQQAEESARLKNAFLASMSHEIRTPLTSIIGYAQMLGTEIDPTHHELVEPIEAGGLRLLETLNSVLDFARIEAGHVELVCEPVNASAEIRSVARLMQQQAKAKGITLKADLGADDLMVLADRPAFSRIITNLVSNAVKFTDSGSVTIELDSEPESGSVVMRIIDTGRGIDAAFLPALFEPFRQESTGLARSHEGSGLGLTITQRLIELMNGSIQVESEVGQGTVFTVSLADATVAKKLEAAPLEEAEIAWA